MQKLTSLIINHGMEHMRDINYWMHIIMFTATYTVKAVLGDHPKCHQQMVSQNRWSPIGGILNTTNGKGSKMQS